jgi:hypothetical protein
VIQAGIDQALPLFGGMVFRILTQVAVCACFQDLFGKLVAQFVFQRGDFVLQLLLEIGHRDGAAPTVTL